MLHNITLTTIHFNSTDYIGTDEAQWHQYDATSLMRQKAPTEKPSFDNILIDVGTADNFYTGGQLLCEVNVLLTVLSKYISIHRNLFMS